MTPAKPVIGILRTGAPPADLADRFPDYADMVMTALGDGFAYCVWDVRAGDVPSGDAADAFVLTGSDAHAYDPDGWIEGLKAWLRGVDRPLIGICFGHQIMAEAFGGRVERWPEGWRGGTDSYALTGNAPCAPDMAEFTLPVSHEDQVTIVPEDAAIIAWSDWCRAAALHYPGRRALSFQAHPEFSADYARSLIDRREALGRLSAEAAAEARARLARERDNDAICRWIARFIEGAA